MKELLEEQNIVRICDCCGTATIDIDPAWMSHHLRLDDECVLYIPDAVLSSQNQNYITSLARKWFPRSPGITMVNT